METQFMIVFQGKIFVDVLFFITSVNMIRIVFSITFREASKCTEIYYMLTKQM